MLSCLRTLWPLRDAQQEQEQRDHGLRDALPCQTTGVSPPSPTASPSGGRYSPGTLVEELFEAKAHPEEELLLARRWSHPEKCGLPTLEPALAARLAAEAERQEMAQRDLWLWVTSGSVPQEMGVRRTLTDELFGAKAFSQPVGSVRFSLPQTQPVYEQESPPCLEPELKVCRADAPAVGSLIR